MDESRTLGKLLSLHFDFGFSSSDMAHKRGEGLIVFTSRIVRDIRARPVLMAGSIVGVVVGATRGVRVSAVHFF